MNRAGIKEIFKNDKGVVLVTTLMIISLLLGAGTGAIVSTQTDLRISNNLKKNGKAFYIAQAGLNHARHELVDNDGINDYAAVSSASGATVLFSNTRFSSGSYTVIAEGVPGSIPNHVRVTSIGCIPAANPCPAGSSRAVTEAQFKRDSLFSNALFAREEINISGGSITDSFDSRVAPYDLASAGDEGSVSSNGNITLSGISTTVNGDATATGTVAMGGATITGVATSGAASVPVPPLYSPCGPSFSDGTGISGGDYDSTKGELQGSGYDSIVFADGVYCLSSIKLTNNSSLTVNGPVLIHLTDKSDLSGGIIVNTTRLASNLTFKSSYSSASQGISVTGGSDAYMSIHAPDARVKVAGEGDFFGAIVGRSIDIVGASKFHYDKALEIEQAGPVEKITWKEVF